MRTIVRETNYEDFCERVDELKNWKAIDNMKIIEESDKKYYTQTYVLIGSDHDPSFSNYIAPYCEIPGVGC